MITFSLPSSRDSREFRNLMRERHSVEVKVVPRRWANGIRLSTHVFNSEDQVDTVLRLFAAELA